MESPQNVLDGPARWICCVYVCMYDMYAVCVWVRGVCVCVREKVNWMERKGVGWGGRGGEERRNKSEEENGDPKQNKPWPCVRTTVGHVHGDPLTHQAGDPLAVAEMVHPHLFQRSRARATHEPRTR